MDRKALAVVGMPGSGKGTFSSVAGSRGWNVIAFGDISREVAKRELGSIDNALAVGEFTDKMRKERGLDWIAKEAVRKAETLPGNVCFDSVRTLEEIACLRGKYPHLKIVGILAPDEKRYDRLMTRARWDDKGSLDELKKKDQKGGAWGIQKVLEIADIRIENQGPLEEMQRKCSALLDSL
jgi:dephospho-CoA kinase